MRTRHERKSQSCNCSCARNAADQCRDSVVCEELHPATLMILQAITRPFDLYESIAFVLYVELDEIRQSARVAFEIDEHPLKDELQVRSGNARERELNQFLGQSILEHEWIADA